MFCNPLAVNLKVECMRIVVTLILRLLEDTDLPQGLRGTLQRIPERQTYPFANVEELLYLLDLNSSLNGPSGSEMPGVAISPNRPDSQNNEGRSFK